MSDSSNRYVVYIVRNGAGRLYIGQSKRFEDRLQEHGRSRGAAFARGRGVVEVVYQEQYDTLEKATKRERQVKRWSKAKKEALIQGNIEQLRQLSRGSGKSLDTLGTFK